MGLPKIDIATFELKLPSTGQKIKYRPFLVKEEKILLIAAESKDNGQILHAMEQVISNCLIDKIDMEDMPSFDVEYIFLKLREKSMGEVIKVNVVDPEEKKKFEVNVDLNKVVIKKSPNHEKRIKLSNTLFIEMKYPNMQTILSVDPTKPLIENGFTIITNCIDKIYDGDTVHEAKDYTKKELQEFIEQFTQDMYDKLGNFFETMPSIYYESEEESPYTKKKIKVVLDKFIDFFD
jgi:hypothetical protein